VSDTSTQVDEWDPRWDDDPHALLDEVEAEPVPEVTAQVDPVVDKMDIRTLRERAKRTERAEAHLAVANRKVAILESGLDVESPIGQLFVKGYDGEFTAEALKAEAARYGVPRKFAEADPPPSPVIEMERYRVREDGFEGQGL
jgi:hypothetical protein